MADLRARLNQLLTDSGTYQQGRHDERLRLQQLIDVRIDQLRAIPRTQQLCAELLHIRQQLEP
jgi:hypothetical protein